MPVRPPIKVLVYGSPGEGKTHFLSSFPKPMLVISFDPMGKNKPYLKRGNMLPQPVIGEYGEPIWQSYSKRDPERLLVAVEVWADLPIETAYKTFITHRFADLYEEVRAGQWATVVLDTLSSAELSARMMCQHLNPKGDGKQWAQGTTDEMEKLVLRILSLSCNVAIAAHVDKDKDEILGRMVGTPAAPGRLQKKEGLAAKFPEIYRINAVRDNEGNILRTLQTRTDQRYLATSVFVEAPDPCNADYNALWSNWDAEQAAAEEGDKP